MDPERLRILIVDDSPEDREVYRRFISRDTHWQCAFLEAESGDDGLGLCRAEHPDCALLDYSLPDLDGLEFLRALAADQGGISVPIVMLTGQGNEDVAAQAMNHGAQDYLVKGNVNGDSLCRTIRYAIHRQRAMMENRRLIENLSARNQEILQLTYAMTHDLQTPLASLTGSIDFLRERIEPQSDAQTGKWLDRLDTSVERMTTMLEDLMSYARVGSETMNPATVEMEGLMNHLVQELADAAASKGIDLDVVRPLPALEADPKLLRRAFANLIGNAVKHSNTDDGGRITIAAQQHGAATEQEQETVRISIADTGPGIDPAQLERVFLPFKRATAGVAGSGIGLATVKRIVEKHQGRVWLESDGRTGTTAYVELPFTARRAAKAEAVTA